MRHYLVILFAVGIFTVPWFSSSYPSQMKSFLIGIEIAGNQLANILLSHNPKTIAQIQSRYDSARPRLFKSSTQKVRILLVPGHEPTYGGAEYGALKERNMTVELAENLRRYISLNNRYEVFVSRDTNSWNTVFQDYFKNHADTIMEWQKAHKENIINMTRLGEFRPINPAVFHNAAPKDVAMRLYGIDKWSNDNDIDIVIHIHFNDYWRYGQPASGKYSGFAIYVPEKQYFNSTTTRALADTVFSRLKKYNAVSNLPGESSGIVEDQDLIAVGSYNSVNAASMLIEYGYIYEPQFTDDDIRNQAIKDLAFQTYLGLQDFFEDKKDQEMDDTFGTTMMPYTWPKVSEKNMSPIDVFAIQSALLLEGAYPPEGKTMNDCPRSGTMGPCTKSALEAFQEKYEITGEKGRIGPKTLQVLNHSFGPRVI